MAELLASDLSSRLHGAIQVIDQVTGFVKAINDLMEQHEELQLRFDRLERECGEVREREETAHREAEVARREAEETAQTLAKLRVAHEALIIEHGVGRGAFLKPKAEHDVDRDGEDTAEALAELRSAYEALIVEHELSTREFRKLQDEHDALLEGRRQIAEELGAVLSSLKTGAASVALGGG